MSDEIKIGSGEKNRLIGVFIEVAAHMAGKEISATFGGKKVPISYRDVTETSDNVDLQGKKEKNGV